MSQINPDVKWATGMVLGVISLALGVFGGWQIIDALGDGFRETRTSIRDGFREVQRDLDNGFREIQEGLQRVEKAQLDATAAPSVPAITSGSTDFGVDDGPWVNDDQCDDSRFTGPEEYLYEWPFREYDGRDATDCRELVEAGHIAWDSTL